MELRHLRHFVAVAEELHFARAAERLGIEQSPLSQSIRNLEAQLGIRLFHRTTRRTWLTKAGARFYHEARRILGDVDALAASLRRSDSEEPSVVRLALGEDLASEPFTRLLAELENRTPELSLEVREFPNATEAARLVRDGGADVAITLTSRSEQELAQTIGWSEPLMAVVPIEHAFRGRAKVSVRDLNDETLALPSAAQCPGYLAQIEELLARHKVRPVGRREVSHWNTAISFAATGHALALCPATMVHTPAAVAMIPLQETDAELNTWLRYNKGEPSSAVTLVLQLAADVASLASNLSGKTSAETINHLV